MGTLVERTTGYLFLLHLPDGTEADKVDAAMRRAVTKLPGELLPHHHLGPGQGDGQARQLHASTPASRSTSATRTAPGSDRSNENTNGLLRQYMPKGTDLSLLTEADLDTIARSLNNRPRKRLEFMKPSERLAELLAMTG